MAERPESLHSTVDPREIAHFDSLAKDWWNPIGKMKPLHRINPVRLAFIRDQACLNFGKDPKAPKPLSGLSILDIGCGGGLLSEPLARMGAAVTGIDPGPCNIEIAKAHAGKSRLDLDYRATTAEELVASAPPYDIVLAMEVVEHVASVSDFIRAGAQLVNPRGLFIGSTINRTLRAYALAIIGAEYILRWLPVGTHAWEKFVTPAEFSGHLAKNGLTVGTTAGMTFSPMSDDWRLTGDTSINYFIVAQRPAT